MPTAHAASTAATAVLSRFRGQFADDHTDEDIDRVLGAISRELGIHFCCVWEHVDDSGPKGSSELIAIIDNEARPFPDGLWNVLFDGADPAPIDSTTIPAGAHPEVALARLCARMSERGHNRGEEDRRSPVPARTLLPQYFVSRARVTKGGHSEP
jgi:hypothetical protein